MFEWTNSENSAKKVGLDVCWLEASGNTFTFFDACLRNGLYVTIGMRHTRNGIQKASMSILHNPSIDQVHDTFLQLLRQKPLPCLGFAPFRGSENDVYYIGNFSFRFGKWYRLIITAGGNQVEGFIYDWSNQKVVKIGTFLTGKESEIEKKIGRQHTNGIALEHYGMTNACKCKSSIMIRNPIRVDKNGLCGSVISGRIDYQKCFNSDVKVNSKGRATLCHGGSTVREQISGRLKWSTEELLSPDIDLSECNYDKRWNTWRNK